MYVRQFVHYKETGYLVTQEANRELIVNLKFYNFGSLTESYILVTVQKLLVPKAICLSLTSVSLK